MVLDVPTNLNLIKERIQKAEKRGGRRPGVVKLLAVTKKVTIEEVKKVSAEGITDFAENRVQELLNKYEQMPNVNWHLIGHLQTNKVKYMVNKVVLVHSLDRWKLAETISRIASFRGITVDVLIQVNVSGEETKFGLPPRELEEFVKEVVQLPGLNIKGLMTMAPFVDNPEEVRPIFRELHNLRQKLNQKWPQISLTSMGMSNDYEVAVEEGSDIVRIGSALFRG
ncbi:MAG: YggS family pyridoxal phosphate-dependent enzyme [Firmicutes bacterium]|nr:YggS family pyridoxal phosphate-dependent enzyme [Bacillota bacterium]